MNPTRRSTMQLAAGAGLYGALAALGLAVPASARAQVARDVFQVAGISNTMKALGAAGAAESKDIVITSPDIAENGAVVPVTVRSNLPKTESIALLVEKNPNALAGAYDFLDGAVPEVAMRVKMGQSSDVFAVVKADGKFFVAKKEIKVTLGGCGG